MADGQGEAQVLDWLEVEDGASDWLNGFFTFLYGLINPLESLEEEQDERRSSGVAEAQDEDEEDEDEERVRQRRMKEQDKGGQKIIIVGLHNQ